MDFPLFQVNSFASFANTACSFFEAHTKLLIVCILQEDETVLSFPPESCVYADLRRPLIMVLIIMMTMMLMILMQSEKSKVAQEIGFLDWDHVPLQG